jgi:hypothetical protein
MAKRARPKQNCRSEVDNVHLILPSSPNLASTLRSSSSSICCHERDAWDLERADQSDAPPSRMKELAAPRRHRSPSSRLHDERRRIGRASSSSRSWTGRRLICSSFAPDLIWSYFLILGTFAHTSPRILISSWISDFCCSIYTYSRLGMSVLICSDYMD